MEYDIICVSKPPFYVLRTTRTDGLPLTEPVQSSVTEVLAKVSSEALGQLVVASLPCADNQQIELFAQDEFTRTLEPGETW